MEKSKYDPCKNYLLEWPGEGFKADKLAKIDRLIKECKSNEDSKLAHLKALREMVLNQPE